MNSRLWPGFLRVVSKSARSARTNAAHFRERSRDRGAAKLHGDLWVELADGDLERLQVLVVGEDAEHALRHAQTDAGLYVALIVKEECISLGLALRGETQTIGIASRAHLVEKMLEHGVVSIWLLVHGAAGRQEPCG